MCDKRTSERMKVPFTTQDVSAALKVGPRRVQQLEEAGVLHAIRTPGGLRLFDPEQVEAVRQAREKNKTERRP